MPFDYPEYQQKVDGLTTEQLHQEWENYTRQISGGATSTTASILLAPFTGGVSLLGLAASTPRIHNARKKREIIEAGLQARQETHHTRKRDVLGPMALGGTLGALTMGFAGTGADMLAAHGLEAASAHAVSHVALDAGGAALENKHIEHEKHKAEHSLELKYEQEQIKIHGADHRPGLPVTHSAPEISTQGHPLVGTAASGDYKPTLSITQSDTVVETLSHHAAATIEPALYAMPGTLQTVEEHDHKIHRKNLSPQVVARPLPHHEITNQPEKYLVTVPSSQAGSTEHWLPEKTPAHPSTTPNNGKPHAEKQAEPAAPAVACAGTAHDIFDDLFSSLSLEDQHILLKAESLRQELEKRGQSFKTPAVDVVKISDPPAVIATRPGTSPEVPAQPIVMPLQQQYYPPPPLPQTPAKLHTTNPQVQFERKDSGYYSTASTPHPETYNTSAYTNSPHPIPPSQYHYQYQPQAYYKTTTPYSPPQPPQPPPYIGHGIANPVAKDYFGQAQTQQQYQPQYQHQNQQQPRAYGVQPAGVVIANGEPNYGPPPPIPGPWRGS